MDNKFGMEQNEGDEDIQKEKVGLQGAGLQVGFCQLVANCHFIAVLWKSHVASMKPSLYKTKGY